MCYAPARVCADVLYPSQHVCVLMCYPPARVCADVLPPARVCADVLSSGTCVC